MCLICKQRCDQNQKEKDETRGEKKSVHFRNSLRSCQLPRRAAQEEDGAGGLVSGSSHEPLYSLSYVRVCVQKLSERTSYIDPGGWGVQK